MHKEHEGHFANQYRQAQVTKLLRLFRAANGRDATSTEELQEWCKTLPQEPVEPDREDYEAVRNVV